MLAYILAIAVGLASLSLYLSAFFLPELHRKDDFLWSGVGLFYALVLWVCAGRITGGVLLGQSAAVTLVVCFGWQTLRLRRAIAHPDEKTDIRGFSLVSWVQNRFPKKSPTPTPPVDETPEKEPPTGQEKMEVSAETETETTEEETSVTSEVEPEDISEEEMTLSAETEIETPVTSEVEPEESSPEDTSITSSGEIEPTVEEEASSTITQTPENKKQGFSLKSLFGLGKSKSQPTMESAEKLTPEVDLEESNWDEENEEIDSSDTEEVTSTLVEETEVIESEPVAETSEVKQEQTTEKKTPEMTESLEEYVAEFEPYLADDDAETLIEDYQPNTESSNSETKEKDQDQPVENESNQETGKNEQEKQSD